MQPKTPSRLRKIVHALSTNGWAFDVVIDPLFKRNSEFSTYVTIPISEEKLRVYNCDKYYHVFSNKECSIKMLPDETSVVSHLEHLSPYAQMHLF